MTRPQLFLSAAVQVALVSLNVWQISHGKWVSGAVVSFCISFVWTLNVKRVAFGQLLDRVVYAAGAMCGFLAGYGLSQVVWGG